MKDKYRPVVECDMSERPIDFHVEKFGGRCRISFEHRGTTLVKITLSDSDAWKLVEWFR